MVKDMEFEIIHPWLDHPSDDVRYWTREALKLERMAQSAWNQAKMAMERCYEKENTKIN